jgi:hypothetical protein
MSSWSLFSIESGSFSSPPRFAVLESKDAFYPSIQRGITGTSPIREKIYVPETIFFLIMATMSLNR